MSPARVDALADIDENSLTLSVADALASGCGHSSASATCIAAWCGTGMPKPQLKKRGGPEDDLLRMGAHWLDCEASFSCRLNLLTQL